MARKALFRSELFPYHVVNRANNKEWFHLPLEQLWPLFVFELNRAAITMGSRIHSFVLMSNHYHLLISTPEIPLDVVMREIQTQIVYTANKHMGRTGHLFNGRYKWSLITHPTYFMHATRYVYQNPLKAGLVEKAEDYKYSSLHGLCGLGPHELSISRPVLPGMEWLLPHETENLPLWINRSFNQNERYLIKNALSKREYRYPKQIPADVGSEFRHLKDPDFLEED